MLPHFRLLPVAIAFALTACSQELTPPQPSPSLVAADAAPIIADSVRYTLERTSDGWQGKIGYVFTNTTDRPVSILNCNGKYALRLEKQAQDKWVSALSPAVPECLSPPIQIMPGSSVQDEVEIWAGFSGSNLYPQFTVHDIDGMYRLVIGSAYWNYNHNGPPWGESLPLEYRVSNSFEIRTR